MIEHNPVEMMVVISARTLEDGAYVVVGTGAPCAAAMLAQKMHAPNLLIMFESGSIGPGLPALPISVGDSRATYNAMHAASMATIMDACSRGVVNYTFLGGAQIDAYGNMNSTCIGDWGRPKVRFPGSGGANDLASLCGRIIVTTPQDRKRFAEKIDFVTTPGYLTGKGAREAAGLPAGTGPYRVITNLAVMGFDNETCRMKVLSIHAGHTRDEVMENTGFELTFAADLGTTEPPTSEELRILRDEVDPARFIIGR